MSNDSLGDRMKNYESVSQTKLIRRTPVIIRIDGKAFHTWTKRLKNFDNSLQESPFSEFMNYLMVETSKYLLNNIQNAKLIYTQSDEISVLLNDWETLETSQWFDAKVQKIASVSASMATAAFNRKWYLHHNYTIDMDEYPPAMFDARVFNLPVNEVTNYFIWRQQDASRNSVQMLARFYFSHKELQGKSNSEIQDMLMLQHNINWNDISAWKKRGTCVYRVNQEAYTEKHFTADGSGVVKDSFIKTDRLIPIFTKDRNFIEQFLSPNEG